MRYLVKVHEYIVKKCLVKTASFKNKRSGSPNWVYKMSKVIKVDKIGKKSFKVKNSIKKKIVFEPAVASSIGVKSESSFRALQTSRCVGNAF